MATLQEYWNKIYLNNNSEDLSWTQKIPTHSLMLIAQINLPKDASIIDVGGGDSLLVDYLLELGYSNITVLDISTFAIEKCKERLKHKADKVNWVVADILQYIPDRKFDLWHDRATFHFISDEEQVAKYLSLAKESITGHMIIGTFSDYGPKKCSGLEIKRYSEYQLMAVFQHEFARIKCIKEDHVTPLNMKQNFLFCLFKRMQAH